MAGDSVRDRASRNASGIASAVVTGSWLALLMLGVPNGLWLAVMLVGYIVVVPVVSMLFDEDEQSREQDSTAAERSEQTPLEKLRERYARGELTDEQFEQKLERLLETETIEDAEQLRIRSEKPETEVSTERQRETE